MSHVSVSRRHDLGRAGARRLAEAVLADLRRRHGLSLATRWEGDTLHAEGRGFEARLEAAERDLHLDARLGLMLRPFAGRIRSEVEDHFDRYLNDGSGPA